MSCAVESNFKTGLHTYLSRDQALTPKYLLTKTGLHASDHIFLNLNCGNELDVLLFYMNQRTDATVGRLAWLSKKLYRPCTFGGFIKGTWQ
jgi:hypothetical protein